MEATVRALTKEEWRLWKRVRLQALADSPNSFRTTLKESTARPDNEWRQQVESSAEHERATLLIAEASGEPVGMLFGFLNETSTVLGIHAMWVAPKARRQGVGSQLMKTAFEWARSSGVRRAEIWVTEGNEPAEQLYLNQGFGRTAETQPLRDGSQHRVVKLITDL